MKLLVLGGTRFVGRALVEDALAKGWDVTALNRGVTGSSPDGVTTLLADRTSVPALADALGTSRWDLVVDTWSGAPAVAGLAATVLAGRAARYGYVSSGSVYTWGTHLDETSPLVDADPDATDGDYSELKRGAELAIQRVFPDAMLARAGLILGPYEDIGRLPWWLGRIADGGRVVAPGRPDRPLQYVDARDLAGWMLTGLAGDMSGPVDAVSRSGHASTEQLLTACVQATGSDADLVWFTDAEIEAAGAQPWTQLPCWVPEGDEFAGFLEADTSLAAATGLVCRPVEATVSDTWQWLETEGAPGQRADRDVHGLPADLERRLLATR